MGKHGTFSLDDPNGISEMTSDRFRVSNGRGVYVSHGTIAIYVLTSLALAAAVGVIVHFTHPGSKCVCSCAGCYDTMTSQVPTSPPIDDVTWETCVNMSFARNECLPGGVPCPDPDPTWPPDPPALTNLSLPPTFRPTHYNIDVLPDLYVPDPADFSFTGLVSIFLTCEVASDVIYVHYKLMTIENVSVFDVSTVGEIDVTDVVMDEPRQWFKVHLAREVTPSTEVKVTVHYSGTLTTDMIGMYYSDYEEAGSTKYMMATQFEATDARKAFPCLDEPQLKATFNVTLGRQAPMVAISNMPVIRTIDRGDGWLIDVFDQTPVVMPTYLIAFAIAEYQYIETMTLGGLKPKPLRHWSRPEYIQHGWLAYSLQVSAIMFDHFETYFNFPYELPKMDQISIEDFAAGAMENWGLITYRESRMVWDPAHSTEYEKQRTTATLGHEFLHQWLGNIVTCAWWSDLWLQEGMARYHQHFSLKAAQPDWDTEQIFLHQVMYRAMESDQNGNAHPLHNPVETVEEFDNMFSRITYDKGGCFIRMMHNLVLGNSYQRAMQAYVRKMAYASATYEDLLESWEIQAEADGLQFDVSVSDVSRTWITQPGYPVIMVSRTPGSGAVSLRQQEFLFDPTKAPSDYNRTWEVPFTYVTEQSPDVMKMEWLHREDRTITVNLTDNQWLLGNFRQYGFYRVTYDLSGWNALIGQLNSDHRVIDVASRGQLIDDSYNLARAGLLDHVTALRTTQYLYGEVDYVPWFTARNSWAYISTIFNTHSGYTHFRDYTLGLLDASVRRLGWQRDPADSLMDIYLRTLVLDLCGLYGDNECVAHARMLFTQWRADPNNTSIIPPDIREAVYCTAIRAGSSDDWDFLFERFQRFKHFSAEGSRLRGALSCTTDMATVNRLFTLSATFDDTIASQSPSAATWIMQDIARTPLGRNVVWDYLNVHWDEMASRMSVLHSVVESFSTDWDLSQFREFTAMHPPASRGEQNNYETLESRIQHNVWWRAANEEALFDWLRDATSSKM